MQLPAPRGPLSDFVIETLRTRPPGAQSLVPIEGDPLSGDDFHLALYLCYELHYTGIDGVDPAWEWDPALIGFRGHLERVFESALKELVPYGEGTPRDIVDKLLAALAAAGGPSVSHFIEDQATLEQVHEFVIHRSAYHLKEADPHTWAIPRLRGPAKAALVEIQADEYGGGRGDRVHSLLFAKTMAAMGLDASYGAWIDAIPGVTLATVNLMSMFGLNRRLRGAAVGHLAAFETLSAEPNARYAAGLRRLGVKEDALDFFDEHVEADSVHEVIATHDLVGGLTRDEPQLAPDILWGARCLLALDEIWARRLITQWAGGRSSLRSSESAASRV